jgi:hypothetical protein
VSEDVEEEEEVSEQASTLLDKAKDAQLDAAATVALKAFYKTQL